MKSKKVPEKDITRSIRAYLTLRKVFHWKVFQTLGSTPGISDILGILPCRCECGRRYGRMLAIEVKTARGRLSEAQENFLRNAEEAGAVAVVARGVTDLIERGI
ncbi:MAG TPA: hypothetical protein DF383_09045 [Deltaproteobacteria bacterium]|nr:hypothetical protein [Deltaproteobacteria bacterium]